MPDRPELLRGTIGLRPSLAFSVLLVCHVFAGLSCVIWGAAAGLNPKRRGRHPAFGRVYV
jgi:hypothetical protein